MLTRPIEPSHSLKVYAWRWELSSEAFRQKMRLLFGHHPTTMLGLWHRPSQGNWSPFYVFITNLPTVNAHGPMIFYTLGKPLTMNAQTHCIQGRGTRGRIRSMQPRPLRLYRLYTYCVCGVSSGSRVAVMGSRDGCDAGPGWNILWLSAYLQLSPHRQTPLLR